jgi:hypothetical protein
MSDEATSPIEFEYVVRCNAGDAFATYTDRIGKWRDPRYTANPETPEAVTIEPRVGGRVYAMHADLGEHPWGEVRVWDPGRRLVHTFTLAQNPEHPSVIAVEFADNGAGGSSVRFAHGGWTEANADVRRKFGDRKLLLDRFAALANSGAA